MAKIRGKDTRPEVQLRKALWREGLRFRVHDKSLPGTPDISHKSRKIAIFVDGCFWHGCPEHFKLPKTRSEFWKEKIGRNQEKRKEVLASYHDWMVFECFECEINNNLPGIVVAITAAW
jgi:DNA mismatch endonuclease (patch repair protein)